MAPLNPELGTYILPHDHFVSHLNDRGITIDENLEWSNFQFAGYISKDMVLDVNCWLPSLCKMLDPVNQYLVKILKCLNNYCSSPLSGLFK